MNAERMCRGLSLSENQKRLPMESEEGSLISVGDIARKNVLVGVTGSVAAIKLPKLVQQLLLLEPKVNVEVVVTENSIHFFSEDDIPVKIHRDQDEWKTWQKRADPVLHIELRRWADLLVIAPLDANTMAKITNGFCDNLLTCTVRAWDNKKPLLVCPAMNTHMWEHPLTAEHVHRMTATLGYSHVPPVTKLLACGDMGAGAMAEVSTIVAAVKDQLA